jgi:soluble lytic murein transglycosylase
MASQAMSDEQKAIDWYKIAAKYPTYFYGQLAIHKHRLLDSVGSASDIILPQGPNISGSDIKSISNEISVKIAYILYLMKETGNANKIIEYAIMNSASDGQIAVIMNLINEIKDKELDVKISKIAARKNVFFIKDKFQIVKDIGSDQHSPLVHAIVKQESGFATTALSSAGAIGFMQLMPATAELVCKQLGIKYSKYKLARNDKYNIKIGSYYIKSLINRFEGSEIMAIAGYNAGPHNVDRWVKEFYDPRKTDDLDKVIDWIELITYAETRNYVQRIMENLIVYKYLMSRVNYDAIK